MRQIGAHHFDAGQLAPPDRIRQGVRRQGDDGVQAGGCSRRGGGHAVSWFVIMGAGGDRPAQPTYYATPADRARPAGAGPVCLNPLYRHGRGLAPADA
ncbi:hypothetical protein G6F24_017712 [Rhizopus arrhizus]|nr:hypothetical protein G6F24_017712 [Rhizopus arrhizus]